MPSRFRLVAAVFLFNAVLVTAIMAVAPDQPQRSDRSDYEDNGDAPLAPFCPSSIYCYRILVPMALAYIPTDWETRWRGHLWVTHTLTGSTVALVAAGWTSPFIVSALLQTSYAFTFTAYDPYTADPTVFLVAALMLWAWVNDRWAVTALMAAVFVFAKETVALLASVPAIAAVLYRDRPTWWRWCIPAVVAWTVLMSFHWWTDTYLGWTITTNPAADFGGGSWLAKWLNSNSPVQRVLIVFSAFGFGWLYAILGYRWAPTAFKQLAIASIPPLLVLAYVQTPERAFGNAFYVMAPLGAGFLSRVSPAAAWTTIVTNGLLTTRLGTSSELLPSTTVLLGPAALAAAWAVSASFRNSR